VGRRETRSIWAASEIRCPYVRELGVGQWAGLLGSTEIAMSASARASDFRWVGEATIERGGFEKWGKF
jgi:hypothetical protein